MNPVFLLIITILKWLKWTSNHHSNKAAVRRTTIERIWCLERECGVFYIFSMKPGFLLILNLITHQKETGRKNEHSHESTEYPQISIYLLMQSLRGIEK